MSKVRPKRGSKTSSSAVQPISLTSGTKELGSSEAHHKTHSSSSDTPSLSLSTTSTNFSYEESEILKVFSMFNHSKKKPFRSEEGFGTINPLYNDADELPAPINLPSPIKPTIATSLSMPTMSSLSTTTSGMPSARAETVPTYSRGSFSMTKSTTPNASTPVLPQSRVLSPGRSESEMIKVPTSNPTSPDMPTPPNTPSSPPSSTDQSNLQEQLNHPRTSITSDEVTPPTNPAMQGKGQLYNILGYPVDLPDIKPCHRNNSCISPEDTKTELYPFSKYPKPFIIDSLKDSEKIIRDLVNLGNGIYDDSEKGNYQTSPVKSEHWETLEDKEKTVTACWNHNLDRPKAEDQYHGKGDLTGKQDSNHANNMSQKKANPKKETSDMQDKENLPNKRKSKNDSYGKAPQEQSKCQRCQNGLVENAATKSATIPVITIHENQRDSLYSHLNIPMIDDDLDSRKPDSSTESSSIDFDCLGSEAAELAEQLCEATSEAGRLIVKELKEGIDQGIDYLTKPEDTLEFTWIDAMAGIISIGTFYFDLVSDSLVAYYMHDDPDSKYWFRVTLLLIILPMVLANGFSLYWYWFDERVCEPEGACFKHPKVSNYVWVLRVLAHILLQASPLRQLDILYYGTKSTTETVLREALVDEVMEAALVTQPEDTPARPENKNRRGSRRLSFRPEGRYQNDASAPLTRPESACSRRTGGMCARGGYVALWIHAERDAANVDLLLSLVQDAPLLILHLYIMAHTLPAQAEQGKLSQTIIMQMLSVSVSLLTLAWSVASFVRAIRLAEPTMSNLSLLDLFLLTLAHFCSIAGQVMSFALFASKFVVAFCIIGTVHWLSISTWILIQLLCFPRTTCTRAIFAHDKTSGPCRRLDDVLYSCTMGLIFLFTFIDVGSTAPKTQALLYNVFRLVEEAVLLTLWFVWIQGMEWYHWLPLTLVPVLFCLNLLFDGLFTASTRPVKCIAVECAPKSL